MDSVVVDILGHVVRSLHGRVKPRIHALKLGIFSAEAVLPEEDQAQFKALAKAMHRHIQPEGIIEAVLTQRLAETIWRQRRMLSIEGFLFNTYKHFRGRERGHGTAFVHDASQFGSFLKLAHYEEVLDRRFHRTLRELLRLQEKRREVTVQDAPVIDTEVEVNGSNGKRSIADSNVDQLPSPTARHPADRGAVSIAPWQLISPLTPATEPKLIRSGS